MRISEGYRKPIAFLYTVYLVPLFLLLFVPVPLEPDGPAEAPEVFLDLELASPLVNDDDSADDKGDDGEECGDCPTTGGVCCCCCEWMSSRGGGGCWWWWWWIWGM